MKIKKNDLRYKKSADRNIAGPVFGNNPKITLFAVTIDLNEFYYWSLITSCSSFN